VVDKLRDYGVTTRVFDLVPPRRDDVEFYQGSILEIGDLRSAMEQVDAVMHLAAVADVNDVVKEPHYSEQVNVRGSANVVEAMRVSNISRIIYGSTVWVYEAADVEEVDETTSLGIPTHLYTATKLAGEYYCQTYANLFGLEPTILRYGIPYGPRARPAGVIPAFVRKAHSGEPLTIQGDGSQYRRFVYVEDLAEGNVLALKSDAKNKTYNLDGAEETTIRELAETVRDIIGDVEIDYLPARPGDFSGKTVSTRKAREELGWAPKIRLEEGVRRYIQWLEQQGKSLDERWATVDQRLRA
jgi:UDP-glucose 4-epimerase